VTRWAAAALLGMATVLAAVPCAAGRGPEVQVTSVRAFEHGPSDAQLIELRPRLRRLVGYRSFRIVAEEHRRCGWGTRASFTIPGGRVMHVVPKAMREQAVVMQVRLLDGTRSLIDTDVRLQNRGVMLFGVDREPHAPDGALIIMLRAEE
jgi:hypothetical protein